MLYTGCTEKPPGLLGPDPRSLLSRVRSLNRQQSVQLHAVSLRHDKIPHYLHSWAVSSSLLCICLKPALGCWTGNRVVLDILVLFTFLCVLQLLYLGRLVQSCNRALICGCIWNKALEQILVGNIGNQIKVLKSWAWWGGRGRPVLCEFPASLVYKGGSI